MRTTKDARRYVVAFAEAWIGGENLKYMQFIIRCSEPL